jgi:hypothetical protein
VITEREIRQVVEAADDFGHELRVRRLLRDHWAGVLWHGGTYIDPVTSKPRQYDLRWHLFHREGLAINLAVECKNISPETPIVISGLKRTHLESYHYLMESRTGGSFGLKDFPTYFDVKSMGVVRAVLKDSAIYSAESFVGKSILRIQGFETGKPPKTCKRYIASNDQEIYDRWSQALASARDLVFEARYYASKSHLSHVFTAILPLVVVPNNTLWSVEYDENGKLLREPIETDECEFFVSREITVPAEFAELPESEFHFSHIHFFTLKGFADFLLSLNDLGWLARCFPDRLISEAKSERLA